MWCHADLNQRPFYSISISEDRVELRTQEVVMLKKMATCLIVFLISLFSFAVQTIKSQEDYSYVLGVWESKSGSFTSEITIKEILAIDNKAVVFVKWPENNSSRGRIPAGSYEVNNALFKPGPEPVIEYKSATSGNEQYLKFNRNGTGTIKSATGRGGEWGTITGDLKKK